MKKHINIFTRATKSLQHKNADITIQNIIDEAFNIVHENEDEFKTITLEIQKNLGRVLDEVEDTINEEYIKYGDDDYEDEEENK